MPIKMTNCSATGCNIGLEAPADADIEMISTAFTDCGVGVRIVGSAGLMGALGLKADTPPELVASLIQGLMAAPAGREEISKRATSTRLMDWLAAGSSVATLVEGIVKLQGSGALRAALRYLGFPA